MPRSPSPPTGAGAGEPSGGSAWEPVVTTIGPKVRALRQERGLSLQQLAHASDISAASVHKVERGDMVPTVTTLLKIAAALETPVRHFVEDGGDDAPLATRARGLESEPTTAGATTISGPSERYRSSAVVTRLEPNAQRKGQRRPGEALVLVVHGHLAVRVGDEDYMLAAGDSLHFHTHVRHSWSNPGSGVAQAAWFSVPDD